MRITNRTDLASDVYDALRARAAEGVIGTLADVGKAFLVCDACDHCVSKFGIYRDGDPCPSCIRTLEVSNG